MKIISHRGVWGNTFNQNTKGALQKSFLSGFGLETDIRDYKGALVISHDIADNNSISIDDYFDIINKCDENNMYINALNIKADGLQNKLLKKLSKYKIKNYFVFDMSVPDTLGYIEKEINFFTRQSDIETNPVFYEESSGVWMDGFYYDWIKENDINKHLDNGKMVCLVSPELHKRSYNKFWEQLRCIKNIRNNKIILCTDFPYKAKEYFK